MTTWKAGWRILTEEDDREIEHFDSRKDACDWLAMAIERFWDEDADQSDDADDVWAPLLAKMWAEPAAWKATSSGSGPVVELWIEPET